MAIEIEKIKWKKRNESERNEREIKAIFFGIEARSQADKIVLIVRLPRPEDIWNVCIFELIYEK